ncbi:MAG TPA: exodeoxyribonuclease V subunit alpha [Desulfobacterales bacterium]|nr:exodeoxyribonuclease V subunit alpha [Desulfobacterales bacterium]
MAEKDFFSQIDIHFAKFVERLSGNENPEIFLAAALVSRVTGNGDTCLDLATVTEDRLPAPPYKREQMILPPLDIWRDKLAKSPVVGKPGDYRPLILDKEDRLYLYRYWIYEKRLSDSIKNRTMEDVSEINWIGLKESLRRLFSKDAGEGTNWQTVASVTAVLKKFCVISGGPGTGKTFTVAKILALFLEQAEGKKLRIFLSAPTGKAAARLKESMQTAKQTLRCNEKIRSAIPEEAFTLHRMLKSIPDSPYFHYNSENPLPADIVVIDEASMVDLALMSKLVEATPVDARIILIGDKDQLASVDAGSVLGDICNRNEIHRFSEKHCSIIKELTGEKIEISNCGSFPKNRIQDAIVELKQSFRFPKGSAIGRFSQAVKNGDADRAIELLQNADRPTIKWKKIRSPKDLHGALGEVAVKHYAKPFQTDDPSLALDYFNRFKILCAVKKGPLGVEAINKSIEQILEREGFIDAETRADNIYYKGQPILITRNDYNHDLFNGDMGVIMPVEGAYDHELNLFFPGTLSGTKRLPLYQLPPNETAYAMTVHKSQGSEFDDVVLVLPDQDFPVLTRELLYTAVTRARRNVLIWGSEPILRNMISRKIERTSGLRDALWK